ncbi:MAG: glycerate kinase [Chthoniobacterales bacterium]
MRILIAPDKFKGSLSALQVAEAIKAGFAVVFNDADYELIPIADGGEGTAEAFAVVIGGEKISCVTVDALGRKIESDYLWAAKSGIAVIDMSSASGLWRIAQNERDPMKASTFGTGVLIRDAFERGARRIYVGLGGSATNDGGCGMAAALGWRFLAASGSLLEPTPEELEDVTAIEAPGNPLDVEIIGLADVKNPLLGNRGASAIYGPQKGADPAMVQRLDAILEQIADCFARVSGKDPRETPGAGAAGGLGFGILAFMSGMVEPGFDAIAELVSLAKKIQDADLVLTGEWKLDSQTLEGKGPAGVAVLAQRFGKPVIAFGGAISDEEKLASLFTACFAIANRPLSLEESEKDAAVLLTLAATRVARVLKCGNYHS